MTALEYDENFSPIGNKYLKNCEIKEYKFNWIFLYNIKSK